MSVFLGRISKRRSLSRVSGFTLMELMIVVAIVGILAAVALPSFFSQVTRTNQNAAQSVMLDIANRQEQIFLANRRYVDKVGLEATGYTLDADVARNFTYRLTTAAGPPPTYTLTFTPRAGAGGGDVTFVINSSGVKTPPEYWDR